MQNLPNKRASLAIWMAMEVGDDAMRKWHKHNALRLANSKFFQVLNKCCDLATISVFARPDLCTRRRRWQRRVQHSRENTRTGSDIRCGRRRTWFTKPIGYLGQAEEQSTLRCAQSSSLCFSDNSWKLPAVRSQTLSFRSKDLHSVWLAGNLSLPGFSGPGPGGRKEKCVGTARLAPGSGPVWCCGGAEARSSNTPSQTHEAENSHKISTEARISRDPRVQTCRLKLLSCWAEEWTCPPLPPHAQPRNLGNYCQLHSFRMVSARSQHLFFSGGSIDSRDRLPKHTVTVAAVGHHRLERCMSASAWRLCRLWPHPWHDSDTCVSDSRQHASHASRCCERVIGGAWCKNANRLAQQQVSTTTTTTTDEKELHQSNAS